MTDLLIDINIYSSEIYKLNTMHNLVFMKFPFSKGGQGGFFSVCKFLILTPSEGLPMWSMFCEKRIRSE